MKRIVLKVSLVLVVAHLLFGAVLLIIDAVHGINDQDFSFALMLLFYYLNYSGVLLLKYMGVTINILPLMLAGLIQWFVIGAFIGCVASLFCRKKERLS
ncbi:MAG: hypothetical protein K9M75_05980 [Phycisphaerae bacterium]|nr:hypothetical protein [Phycisphaerae bacterium]